LNPLEKTGLLRFVKMISQGHTFSVLAMQDGVDVKTLSGFLGYYSAGVTLDTYGHITAAMKQDAANRDANARANSDFFIVISS